MDIEIFSTLPISTNCYLLVNGKEAVLIDAGFGIYDLVKPTLEALDCTLKGILLTHSHWDHIAGLNEIQHYTGCETYCHLLDKENVYHPGLDAVPSIMDVAAAKVDHTFNDGDNITLAGMDFRVLHTPGHSPGSVSFLLEKENILFSGDTLFKGTCGNFSFPTSSPEEMAGSLTRLSHLKKEITVYPGHGTTTTIGDESWIAGAASII